MSLEPLTDYSKFKADCEKILLENKTNKFTPIVIRPATVCGYSPRQRLDVVVNILTNLAYHKKEITVFGGEQLRPNIHIFDMVRAYECLIEAKDELVSGKIFNAGYENQTVNHLASSVKEVVGDEVIIKHMETNDNRSYHISSKKIFALGLTLCTRIPGVLIKQFINEEVIKKKVNNIFMYLYIFFLNIFIYPIK